ncbi:MAG: hypothetical protein H6Q67_1978 [Firmicutes bacterium]|nr:hypothetical protein [Bacillota bacterium]
MTREEVLEKLAELGITISGETLRRWVNAELVPSPKRGNRGRAGGRWSEYPAETPWEAFASGQLLNDCSIKRVAEVRQEARSFIAEMCFEEMENLSNELEEWQKENAIVDELEGDHGVIEASYTELPSASEFPAKIIIVDTLVFSWLMARIKAEYSIPIDTTIQVCADYNGYWTEGEWARFTEPHSEKFNNDVDAAGGKYIVDWSIVDIKKHVNIVDEIIITDSETGATLIMKTRKKRI